ncbi:MAG: response regulator transcription factor [Epsilonproteobacteria bacterium]|nr:response regulator transcription factor [Campylobacterota bacterium]
MQQNKFDILDSLCDKNVLYAEDEEGIREVIIEILELFFAKVVSVENGLEALNEMSNNNYDVLIFDVSMPKLDGIETIRKIRKTNKKIPIIILSAHTEQEYLWKVIELKITKYLAKPCDKTTFIDALELASLELMDFNKKIKLHENCIYNPFNRTLNFNEKSIKLSKNESKLLEYFIKHTNQIVTFDKIYNYLWEFDTPSKEAIKFIVKGLRKKIGRDMIKNIYGEGYIYKNV